MCHSPFSSHFSFTVELLDIRKKDKALPTPTTLKKELCVVILNQNENNVLALHPCRLQCLHTIFNLLHLLIY